MENKRFSIGDVVQLKSGGEHMTVHKDCIWEAVEGIYDYSIVVCVWLNLKKELQKKQFRVDTLNLISNTNTI